MSLQVWLNAAKPYYKNKGFGDVNVEANYVTIVNTDVINEFNSYSLENSRLPFIAVHGAGIECLSDKNPVFTISFWIYYSNEIGNKEATIFSSISYDNNNYITIGLKGEHLFFRCNGSDFDFTDTTVPNLNWLHVAITYNGKGEKLFTSYLNGVKINEILGDLDTKDTISYYDIGGFSFRITDFRIYDEELTYKSITKIYNEGFYQINKLLIWLPFHKDFKNYGFADNAVSKTSSTSLSSEQSLYTTNSALFNSASSYVNISSPSSLMCEKSKLSATIWAYPLGSSASKHIFAFINTRFFFGIWNNGFYLRTNATGSGGSATVAAHKIMSLPEIPIEQWTHYACVFDRGNISVYINGDFYNSASTVENDYLLSASTYLRVGSYSPSYPYSGYLSDFRLYDSALGPDYVKKIYNYSLMDIQSTDKYNNGIIYDNSGLLIKELIPNNVTFSGNTMIFTGGTDTRIRPSNLNDGFLMSGGTMSIWFSVSAAPSDNRVVYIDSKSHMALGFYSAGSTLLVNAGISYSAWSYTAKFNMGGLNHVLVVYTDTACLPSAVYVNGSATTKVNKYTAWSEKSGITIGGRTYNNTSNFDGKINKVTIFKKQFTEADAVKEYLKYCTLFNNDYD